MSSQDLKSLRYRVLRAGGWNTGGYALAQAIRLGSNLIMTRLLIPEMFGIMSIATMVTVILNLLSDIGLGQNIVQSKRGDDPVFLDTAWVLQIFRGIIIWLLGLGLSIALHFANAGGLIPAGSAYASPVLPPVIAVICFEAVISSFASTKMATASRNLDQKRIVQIRLITQIVALIVMIPIGVMTRSIWALVAGGLVAPLTSTTLSHTWMSGHANRFRWERNARRELIGFGKWIFVSSVVGVLAMNGDRLLLGGFVDTHFLGLYAIAVLMVGAIEGGVVRLFSHVWLPALSEIARDNPSKLREVYYKLRIPGDLLLLFLMGLLFSAGQLVIDLLYDPRYAATGGILQILALSLFTLRYGVAQQVYLAVGIPRYLAIVNVVRFVSLYTLVPALYYTAGVHAAILGIALHALPAVPLIYVFNATLGLNDFRRELMVLVALPVGILCGTALNLLR